MQSEPFYGMRYAQLATKVLALLFNIALLIAATIEISRMFAGLIELNITSTIQDGLFVMIFLELFYVVRSFIKYGSVNTGLIISVGILAVVEEIIFSLKTMTLQSAGALSLLLLALSVSLLLEYRSHSIKVIQNGKPRSIKDELFPAIPKEEISHENLTREAHPQQEAAS